MNEQPDLDLGLPPPPPKKPRPRDLAFEAMADGCGLDLTQITSSARGSIQRAMKEIRDVKPDVGAIIIYKAIDFYRAAHPTWPVTPSSVAKYWPELIRKITEHHAKLPPNVRAQLEAKAAQSA